MLHLDPECRKKRISTIVCSCPAIHTSICTRCGERLASQKLLGGLVVLATLTKIALRRSHRVRRCSTKTQQTHTPLARPVLRSKGEASTTGTRIGWLVRTALPEGPQSSTFGISCAVNSPSSMVCSMVRAAAASSSSSSSSSRQPRGSVRLASQLQLPLPLSGLLAVLAHSLW